MKKHSKKFWTPEEEEILRQRFPNENTVLLAKELGRGYGSVSQHANLMGLFKSSEFLSSAASGRLRQPGHQGKLYQFPKGNVPHNKGKAHRPAGSERGWFKKGQCPKNTLYDGATRLNKEGHEEVRVSQGVWKTRQSIIWETENGPVPAGHVLRFKNPSLPNIYFLENIELINRAQNMALNTIQRYPPELISTLKVLSKLKRKINEESDRRPS